MPRVIRVQKTYAIFGKSNKGIAKYDLGEHEAAIKDFNKAIELKPDSAILYNNRGEAFAKMGNREAAIKDFNKAIEIQPDFTEGLKNRDDVEKDPDDGND